MWLASLPTATAAGIPPIIKIGVVKNPPPTPNIPESIPAIKPMLSKYITFCEISAIGKYISKLFFPYLKKAYNFSYI